MWDQNYRNNGYKNETKIFNFIIGLFKQKDHILTGCQSSDFEDKYRKWDFMILNKNCKEFYYDIKTCSSIGHFNFTYQDPSGRNFFEESRSTDLIFVNRNYLYFIKVDKFKEFIRANKPSGKLGHDNTKYFTIEEKDVSDMSYGKLKNTVPDFLI